VEVNVAVTRSRVCVIRPANARSLHVVMLQERRAETGRQAGQADALRYRQAQAGRTNGKGRQGEACKHGRRAL
jgi:hypothetical protein